MTLLVSLIMVFSLFAVTAAVAGPGPGTGDGERVGETVMTQTQERAEVHADDSPCVAGDEAPECEPVRERTQTREQVQEREYDGACAGTDEECEAAKERTQTRAQNQVRQDGGTCIGIAAECEAVRDPIQARDRDRDQIRTSDGACTDCEPAREMTRTEAYERIMERVAAYVDGSGEGGYLFAMVRWIWTHMYGPLSALFL